MIARIFLHSMFRLHFSPVAAALVATCLLVLSKMAASISPSPPPLAAEDGNSTGEDPLARESGATGCDMTWQFECGSNRGGQLMRRSSRAASAASNEPPECIGQYQVCDGSRRHCSDGSDEDPEFCLARRCPYPQMLRCHSGQCIYQFKFCRGITLDSTCWDNSHWGRVKCTSCPEHGGSTYLMANSSRCNSGECILKDHKCDGLYQCPDGSDEKGCGSASARTGGSQRDDLYTQSTGFIVIIVILSVSVTINLLLLAVVLRLYKRRQRLKAVRHISATGRGGGGTLPVVTDGVPAGRCEGIAYHHHGRRQNSRLEDSMPAESAPAAPPRTARDNMYESMSESGSTAATSRHSYITVQGDGDYCPLAATTATGASSNHSGRVMGFLKTPREDFESKTANNMLPKRDNIHYNHFKRTKDVNLRDTTISQDGYEIAKNYTSA